MTARKDEHICRLRVNGLKFATDPFYIVETESRKVFRLQGMTALY